MLRGPVSPDGPLNLPTALHIKPGLFQVASLSQTNAVDLSALLVFAANKPSFL